MPQPAFPSVITSASSAPMSNFAKSCTVAINPLVGVKVVAAYWRDAGAALRVHRVRVRQALENPAVALELGRQHSFGRRHEASRRPVRAPSRPCRSVEQVGERFAE